MRPEALFAHRTVTHSALACVAVPGLTALLADIRPGAAVALVVGGGLQSVMRSPSPRTAAPRGGIRLWAPFSRRRVWLPRRSQNGTINIHIISKETNQPSLHETRDGSAIG